jgi:hypothetical protein
MYLKKNGIAQANTHRELNAKKADLTDVKNPAKNACRNF